MTTGRPAPTPTSDVSDVSDDEDPQPVALLVYPADLPGDLAVRRVARLDDTRATRHG